MVFSNIDNILNCDILVIGGGTAGVGAAVAAVAPGLKVIQVEKNPFLGGIATAGLVSTICGCYSSIGDRRKIIGGVRDAVVEELKSLNGIQEGVNRDTHRSDICDPELLKCALDNVVTKNNIELLLNTQVVDAKTVNKNIKSVLVVNNESGKIYDINPKMIIDASGNALLSYLTDQNSFVFGDEQGRIQASTMVFRVNNVDCEAAREVTKNQIRELILKAKDKGEYDQERENGVFTLLPDNDSAIVNLNWVNINFTESTDLTKGQTAGRKKVVENFLFLKKHVPGFQNSVLSAIANSLGIRETRRIIGEYVLTEKDIMNGSKFEDGIALGSWPMEYHDYTSGKLEYIWLEKDYQIPYRCLIPRHLDNVLVTGRSISTTAMAFASTRVMGPCFAMGQAAGTAMRISVAEGCAPRDVPMSLLRKLLTDEGMIL